MFSEDEDYYKILQVNYNAEPEVIKAAYVNLSKKYHPDNTDNGENNEKIRKINKAYEILSDPLLKEKYKKNISKKKHDKKNIDISIEEKKLIEATVLSYFFYISRGEFDNAYDILTLEDRSKILRSDFIRWQELVAVTFRLSEYSCTIEELQTIEKNSKEYSFFQKIARVKIEVHEENLLMKRMEKDVFYKDVILQDGRWKLFLGYSSIKNNIDRFNSLSMLQKNTSLITLTKSTYCEKKEEFLKLLQREQTRYNRYGNQFSMISCIVKKENHNYVESIINNSLRNLDFGCLWKENLYLIVLPETDELGAKKVAEKILINLEEKTKKSIKRSSIKVKEQLYSTLEELFYNLM